MKIDLTPADRKTFEQYARIHGLASIEQAIQHAAKRAMARMCPLPAKKMKPPVKEGRVVNFEGLKKPSGSKS